MKIKIIVSLLLSFTYSLSVSGAMEKYSNNNFNKPKEIYKDTVFDNIQSTQHNTEINRNNEEPRDLNKELHIHLKIQKYLTKQYDALMTNYKSILNSLKKNDSIVDNNANNIGQLNNQFDNNEFKLTKNKTDELGNKNNELDKLAENYVISSNTTENYIMSSNNEEKDEIKILENPNKINIINEEGKDNINNKKIKTEKVKIEYNNNQESQHSKQKKKKKKKKQNAKNDASKIENSNKQNLNTQADEIFKQIKNNSMSSDTQYAIRNIIEGADRTFFGISVEKWEGLINKTYQDSDKYNNQMKDIKTCFSDSNILIITTDNTKAIRQFLITMDNTVQTMNTISMNDDSITNTNINGINIAINEIEAFFMDNCQQIAQEHNEKYKYITDIIENSECTSDIITEKLISISQNNTNTLLTYNEQLLYKALLCLTCLKKLAFNLQHAQAWLKNFNNNKDFCNAYYKLLLKQPQRDLKKWLA